MHKLPKRLLGNTGLLVSPIGLGTVKIGRDSGVKYAQQFTIPSDKQVSSLLQVAQEMGVNLIDTAPAYGESETRLGKLINNRDDWIICSKVGEEFENGESTFDFSSAHTRFSVERSLKRLQTDVIDLVLIHSNGSDEEIINQTDCISELQKLKDSGHIKAFGMSTKTVSGGLLATQCTDVVMVTYNPLTEEDAIIIQQANEMNKGVLIKKGLLSGHLSSLTGDDNDSVKDSLRFIFEQPGVSSIIIGTINEDHFRENVKDTIEILQAD